MKNYYLYCDNNKFILKDFYNDNVVCKTSSYKNICKFLLDNNISSNQVFLPRFTLRRYLEILLLIGVKEEVDF